MSETGCFVSTPLGGAYLWVTAADMWTQNNREKRKQKSKILGEDKGLNAGNGHGL